MSASWHLKNSALPVCKIQFAITIYYEWTLMTDF